MDELNSIIKSKGFRSSIYKMLSMYLDNSYRRYDLYIVRCIIEDILSECNKDNIVDMVKDKYSKEHIEVFLYYYNKFISNK